MKDDEKELMMVYCVFVGETSEKLVNETNPNKTLGGSTVTALNIICVRFKNGLCM